MRKLVTIIMVLSIMVVGIPSIFAAGAQEMSGESFLDRLDTALENTDFTEEEVEAIIEQANDRSWDDVEGADAEAVAQGLDVARNEEADLDAAENAELAYGLAQNAARLEEENYDENAVSQAVREAVRNQLEDILEWKDGDKSGDLGEMIRSGVSSEARKAAEEQGSDRRDGDSDSDEETPADDEREEKPNRNGSAADNANDD